MYRKYKSGYFSNNSIKCNNLSHNKSNILTFIQDEDGVKTKLNFNISREFKYSKNKNYKSSNECDIIDFDDYY